MQTAGRSGGTKARLLTCHQLAYEVISSDAHCRSAAKCTKPVDEKSGCRRQTLSLLGCVICEMTSWLKSVGVSAFHQRKGTCILQKLGLHLCGCFFITIRGCLALLRSDLSGSLPTRGGKRVNLEKGSKM